MEQNMPRFRKPRGGCPQNTNHVMWGSVRNWGLNKAVYQVAGEPLNRAVTEAVDSDVWRGIFAVHFAVSAPVSLDFFPMHPALADFLGDADRRAL